MQRGNVGRLIGVNMDVTERKEAETRQARGKLKIFFGAAAGVGKTYAMLEAAREQRSQGVDVVVGWVETHGRVETEALLEGLEILPRGIVQLPVLVPFAGIQRTGVTAAHGDHHIGVLDRFRGRVRRAASAFRRLRHRFSDQVEGTNVMPRFGKVGRHSAAHVAEADECDFRHSS